MDANDITRVFEFDEPPRSRLLGEPESVAEPGRRYVGIGPSRTMLHQLDQSPQKSGPFGLGICWHLQFSL